jgi:DNA-directed RNA polymerase subunit K/omega
MSDPDKEISKARSDEDSESVEIRSEGSDSDSTTSGSDTDSDSTTSGSDTDSSSEDDSGTDDKLDKNVVVERESQGGAPKTPVVDNATDNDTDNEADDEGGEDEESPDIEEDGDEDVEVPDAVLDLPIPDEDDKEVEVINAKGKKIPPKQLEEFKSGPLHLGSRLPKPRLSKFERARIIGTRATQIQNGMPVRLKPEERQQVKGPIALAKLELLQRESPLIISRELPNGDKELVTVQEIE